MAANVSLRSRGLLKISLHLSLRHDTKLHYRLVSISVTLTSYLSQHGRECAALCPYASLPMFMCVPHKPKFSKGLTGTQLSHYQVVVVNVVGLMFLSVFTMLWYEGTLSV